MKVAINVCFGGFSLSPRAVKRLAELNGRDCYFFVHPTEPKFDFETLVPITLDDLEKKNDRIGLWSAFDIPNPDEVIGKSFQDENGLYKTYNARYEKHCLSNREVERHDPKLIQVIEELGGEHRQGASGTCAELKIVEIPDGIEYEIEEYDGSEHIAEKHRTWR